jgi:hypothetical protein
MNNPILLLFFSLSFSGVFAQKCKFYDKENPVTGEIMRRTETVVCDDFYTTYCKSGDNYFVSTHINFNGEKNFKIDSGHVMKYRLLDGTIVELVCKEASFPTTKVAGSSVYTDYSIRYYATKEDFEKMSSIGIAALVLSAGGKDFVDQPGEKQSSKISQKIKCLLDN